MLPSDKIALKQLPGTIRNLKQVNFRGFRSVLAPCLHLLFVLPSEFITHKVNETQIKTVVSYLKIILSTTFFRDLLS